MRRTLEDSLTTKSSSLDLILSEQSKWYRDEITGTFDLDTFEITYLPPMKSVGNSTARLKADELLGDGQQQIVEHHRTENLCPLFSRSSLLYNPHRITTYVENMHRDLVLIRGARRLCL
ncbi:uncharacterized protein EV420DRAFT_1343110 [Desarmillaria tabescens]|uniref:Uncharacterized protein n=1 Tax=Armillaria tabescens TaxID=1929756 RepID=A0AA39J596_ARMTA|nr:uncharacterized protein EV420DRAFT_1343110 [Desarmillaria tabescens]KAK0436343.1 hypothetical protein EV420DRAFT_1343110 [Desarmillaria tabescens]